MIEKKLREIAEELIDKISNNPGSQHINIDMEDAVTLVFMLNYIADSINDITMYLGMHPDSDEQPCPPPPTGDDANG